jgi:hypothetical protein
MANIVVVTDASGNFTAQGQVGTDYVVSVSGSLPTGMVAPPAQDIGVLPVAGVTNLKFQAAAAQAPISGMVLDPSGAPLAGVQMTIAPKV